VFAVDVERGVSFTPFRGSRSKGSRVPSLSALPATILLPNSSARRGTRSNVITTERSKTRIFWDDLTPRETGRHRPNRTPKPGVGGSSPSTPASIIRHLTRQRLRTEGVLDPILDPKPS